MRVPAQVIERQLLEIFAAWGMLGQHAAVTARLMVETDLRGIDSHGISMLPIYDGWVEAGELNLKPEYQVVRDSESMSLIDADGSLGHSVSEFAMQRAIDKSLRTGVGIVSVFNSHHFGAAGCYTQMAVDRGVIGLVVSSARGIIMVPTFAAGPVLGTNPLSFAAPARRNPHFLLDMATTTVAAGKVKVHKLNHRPVPAGWVVDAAGEPVRDVEAAYSSVFELPGGGVTPLGGTREMGSHKGYGLAVMVQILAATLSGGAFSPTRSGGSHNVGHFFLALDPAAFRDRDAFSDELDTVIDTLRDADRADPAQPVLVAGDPELAAQQERLVDGIPMPDDLVRQVRAVADRAGAGFLLVPS